MLERESANVIKLVGLGRIAADDSQIEAEVGNIAAQKRVPAIDIELIERQLDDGGRKITPDVVARFGELISDKLRDTGQAARRQYLRLLVDRVEVERKEICISGSKRALSQAAMGLARGKIPRVKRKWRARQESNLWPQD